MSKSIRWVFNFTKWNPAESDLLLATSCIQNEEKVRLARFVFKKDFKSSLIGRLMMRKFVHKLNDIPYKDIKFARDEKGKPYLTNNQSVTFNVSHQGDYAVLAGEAKATMLGVDVMKLEYSGGKSLSEFFRIMTRHFSSKEWETIKVGDDKQQIAMFCRHWCLKESYVKAIGVGITVNLQEIEFEIKEPLLKKDVLVKSTRLFVKGVEQNWCFEEMLLGAEHCVAVALKERTECDVLFQEVDIGELLERAVPCLEFDREYCDNFYKKLDRL